MWHHSSLRPYLPKPKPIQLGGQGGNLKTLVTTSCVEPWEAQSHCEAKILMLELLPMEDNGGQFAVGKVRLCCPRSQLLWATISHELYQILYVPLSSFVEWLRERAVEGERGSVYLVLDQNSASCKEVIMVMVMMMVRRRRRRILHLFRRSVKCSWFRRGFWFGSASAVRWWLMPMQCVTIVSKCWGISRWSLWSIWLRQSFSILAQGSQSLRQSEGCVRIWCVSSSLIKHNFSWVWWQKPRVNRLLRSTRSKPSTHFVSLEISSGCCGIFWCNWSISV